MDSLSINQLVYAAQQNKEKIVEYFQNKEQYGDSNDQKNAEKILGMTLGIFLVILLIGLALYITAVVLLIKYWDQLTDTAKIFGVIGVLPFFPLGPVVTFIAIGVGRKA